MPPFRILRISAAVLNLFIDHVKLIISICIGALMILALYLSSPGFPSELHQDHELPAGKVNPPLRRLDSASVIPTGAGLWFKTNRTSYARALAHDPAHPFSDQPAPATLIQARSGTQWVPRSSLQGSWTDQ